MTATDSDAPRVRITVADAIGEIRFSRPSVLNAVDLAMAEAFAAAVDRLLADPGVRVIVLSGDDRAFIAGGDLATFHAAADKPAVAEALLSALHPALLRLAEDHRPVIASLKGAVAGGGMGIALAADLAIAAENVKFSVAYVTVAANPDCTLSWNLVHTVGLRKAMELALLGGVVDGAEALRLGLVNRLVPTERLEDETRAVALRLAAQSSLSMGRTKALLRAAATTALPAQLDAESAAFVRGAATADFAEAIDAFLGKRKPNFAR